jgi:two-component SAPR family response regulator
MVSINPYFLKYIINQKIFEIIMKIFIITFLFRSKDEKTVKAALHVLYNTNKLLD